MSYPGEWAFYWPYLLSGFPTCLFSCLVPARPGHVRFGANRND
jgi:hypothetical protein